MIPFKKKKSSGSQRDIKKWRFPTRAVAKYVLLQIPSLAVIILCLIVIQRWVYIPTWLFGTIVALWLAKDLALYPLLWRAYDWNVQDPMIGTKGIVKERLSPSGRVQARGEIWTAEVVKDNPHVDEGETVWIQDVKGLTLFVRPDNPDDKAPKVRD